MYTYRLKYIFRILYFRRIKQLRIPFMIIVYRYTMLRWGICEKYQLRDVLNFPSDSKGNSCPETGIFRKYINYLHKPY